MADQIDRVIDVTIVRQTQVPTEESFSELLIASEFLTTEAVSDNFSSSERVREYADLDSVGADFIDGTTLYAMAKAAFIQNPSLSRIFIGRKLTGIEGTETWAVALAAMKAYDNSWYGVTCGTRVYAEQQSIADWVEANEKFCWLGSDDANIVDGTGDIAEYLNTMSYSRSFAVYHPLSNGTPALPGTDTWPDVAMIANRFAFDTIPGESSWAHKTLVGVPVYSITGAQFTTANDKNCTLYQTIGGLSKTMYGLNGIGEAASVVWFTDWLKSHIQTLCYTPLATLPKVPMTDGGIQTIVSQLRKALQDGIDAGSISPDPELLTVTYPLVVNISAQDKANYNLPDIKFTATLSGEIHTTVINGTLVL